MKYFLLAIILFFGYWTQAQGLAQPPKKTFRFYQTKPKSSIDATYKRYLSLLPKKKKIPALVPIRLNKPTVKHQPIVMSPTPLVINYQRNSFTLRYNLFSSSFKKRVPDFTSNVSNFVQPIVPVHPFTYVQKEPTYTFDDANNSVGLTMDKLDFSIKKTGTIPKNTIYPNPTTGIFNIQLDEKATEIKVVNLIGRVVLSQKVDGRSFYGLDISQFPKGTYIASFLQKGKWFSQRLVLVK
ncbi:MAG TPA: T9SS type A sorting domain-containing protein [Saprospiraceae bacterium]|nr:T9SS type A sorting domain-containing protein [Saprospiraceae bacterium]